MNCPMCGHEVVTDETKECPACGEVLIPASFDLVAVKSFDNPLEAYAARAFLETEGIRAFVSDGEMIGAAAYLGNAIGYVKVEVPRDDLETATELLRTAKLKSTPVDDSACLACGQPMPETETRCQSCGWTFAETESEGEEPGEPLPDF